MTLLLLAGSGEARHIARALAKEGRVPAVASYAGATRDPVTLPLPTRVGGFGGAEGFEAYLDQAGITAILDATHPFASAISRRTQAIAQRRGLPYLQLLRPPWRPEPGDHWIPLQSEADAAQHIPAGATVFLATGRQTLPAFEGLNDCTLICRQIDPPDHPFPFPNGRFLVGRPPFSVADETALFAQLGVDWLVVKNAGSAASSTKLVAARNLGLPVAMIERPTQPPGDKVETVDDALDWVRALPW